MYSIREAESGVHVLDEASGQRVATVATVEEACINASVRNGDTIEEAKLSYKQRKNLPKSAFVFPDKAPGPGSYPIHDEEHGRNALSRAAGKPEEGRVRGAVCRRYPDMGECKKRKS